MMELSVLALKSFLVSYQTADTGEVAEEAVVV